MSGGASQSREIQAALQIRPLSPIIVRFDRHYHCALFVEGGGGIVLSGAHNPRRRPVSERTAGISEDNRFSGTRDGDDLCRKRVNCQRRGSKRRVSVAG